MRREADNVGPKAELEHWKRRMAKFNSLVDQIKSTDCKIITGILIAAKSKIVKVSSSNVPYPVQSPYPVNLMGRVITPVWRESMHAALML